MFQCLLYKKSFHRDHITSAVLVSVIISAKSVHIGNFEHLPKILTLGSFKLKCHCFELQNCRKICPHHDICVIGCRNCCCRCSEFGSCRIRADVLSLSAISGEYCLACLVQPYWPCPCCVWLLLKKCELWWGRGSAQTQRVRGIGGRPAARPPVSCREERHGQQGRTATRWHTLFM